MYFLKFLSNLIEKVCNDALKMPSNSLLDADLSLPEMKTKSPSCPAGEVHMYELYEPCHDQVWLKLVYLASEAS